MGRQGHRNVSRVDFVEETRQLTYWGQHRMTGESAGWIWRSPDDAQTVVRQDHRRVIRVDFREELR